MTTLVGHGAASFFTICIIASLLLSMTSSTADAGRALYGPRPHGTAAQAQWRGSITQVTDHVLSPLLHSGQLAGAVA